MNLTSELSRYSKPCGQKRLSAAALDALPAGVLRDTLAQVVPFAAPTEDAWRRVRVEGSFPAEVATQLRGLGVSDAELNTEDAFALYGAEDTLLICSRGERGLLYGACEALQLARANDGLIPGGVRFSAPQCPFRGLKVYMPGEKQLDQFYRVVDMLLYYRYNTLIIEVGGAMEYKSHPEINQSWVEYCKEMRRYPERADEVQGMFGWVKNSIHFENGDGGWLTQDTVRGLLRYCRERGLEVIPEAPCLSHADYLLNAHPELAERAYDPFPDTYCPSNPDSYRLLFDVMDEIIDVFEPKTMQVGHDEVYSIGVCDRCRERDAADLLAGDLTRIHDHLAERGVGMMYWSEKMLNHISSAGEGLGGAKRRCKCSRNTMHEMPATYEAIDRIPRDCWAHHWYWALRESHDEVFLSRGMPMTYGNWDPRGIYHWQARVDAGALGAAPSHWTTLDLVTMQRNGVLLSLVFGAYLFWRRDYTDERYDELLRASMEELYRYLNRQTLSAPHFEITHMTTLWREHVYITSAPMLLERDTVGRYVVTYRSGRELEIPLIYGVNIMNQWVDWSRTRNEEWDCYDADGSLAEVAGTTLPLRQSDGTTRFRFVAENPYPDDPVVGVRVEKTASDEGELFLVDFSVRQSFADSKTLRGAADPSRRVKTPLA